MLHIIFLVLKIIGIILLVILGLLLTVLLLILLVPVRYQLEGSYYGELKGKARITWLLHMLTVTASFDKEFSVMIRFFGFRIFKPTDAEEDTLVHAMEVQPQEEQEIKKYRKEELKKEAELLTEEEKIVPPPEKPEPVKGPVEEKKSPVSHSEVPHSENKIIAWFKKLWNKIKSIFEKLKFSFQGICDKLKAIKDKKEEIQNWISKEDNKKTVKLLFRQIKKLVRHIFPRKGKGKITFGFDDPYTTGQILMYASLVYPFCHKHLELYPEFDREVLEGEGFFKGRIRLGALLTICGRMLFDRNIRTLIKKWLR